MNQHFFNLDYGLIAELGELSKNLPPLPSAVRYFDDFTDIWYSIRDISQTESIILMADGGKRSIHFERFHPIELLIKHIFVAWLQRLDPTTVGMWMERLSRYIFQKGIESLSVLIVSKPFDARTYWNRFILVDLNVEDGVALRAVLHSLCRLNIGHWSLGVTSIIRTLRGPKHDQYRVVRVGDCFVPLDQQALIVNHIDDMCTKLAVRPSLLKNAALRDCCMLVLAYQYALRPGQIARIEVEDVRLYSTGAVHVAVFITKQRANKRRTRATRRIKREWGPLFSELVRRRNAGFILPDDGIPPRLLFGLSPHNVSYSISGLTEELTDESWSPTDLRHTAAQRQTDGGISHASLTEFMFQTSARVASVYFDTSPNQARRINDALAISPIYSNVAKIARTKTIDKAMLLDLPADKQIGAVPHGIPIAGIGGCNLGQSLCLKNPVLSCYTCSRFMPLGDPDIHKEVLESLRPVVTEFAEASRNNQQSPAYAQLRGTLDAVRRVVEGLKQAPEGGNQL